MSDPDRRTLPLADWGEPARTGVTGGDRPAGVDVGELRVRGDVSEKSVELKLSPEQLGQLAMQFAGAMQAAAPVREKPYFGELCERWLARISKVRVQPKNEQRLSHHLRPLFLETEDTLTAEMVDELLSSVARAGLSASTTNKVRAAGRWIVRDAMAARTWHGPNPFDLVRRRREVKPKYCLLTLAELALVQQHLRDDRRRMFRLALHLGLRPGELLALQKSDVSWENWTIYVHRSHERGTTKTGTERVIPILPAVVLDLREAMESSKSELIFPGEGGDLQRRDVKLTRVLRTAMAKARVGIQMITYKCRRCPAVKVGGGIPSGAPIEDVECLCGALMWPVPEVKPVRWYDLRHICATLHHEHKADPVIVALALGHSLKGLTTSQSVYTHPSNELKSRELSKWSLTR